MLSRVFDGLRASTSALAAERVRMEVIAANIANANTVGENGPYVRRSVVFEEILDGRGGAVRASKVYEDKKSEHPRVYDPGHPYADADGFVRRPNVNIMFELVDLMAARRTYAANVAAFQAYRQMLRTAVSTLGVR